MTWISILQLMSFALFEQSGTYDIRSFTMSIMTGWKFQCASITCLPFITIHVLNARSCQTSCLAQVQCQAASFEKSISSCELFANVWNQNNNVSADADTITMIVEAGTRMPLG